MNTAIAPRPPLDLGQANPECEAEYHGTTAAYRHGCRCPHAREAERLYKKRRRERRHPNKWVDPTGTRRRLRALCALGWRWKDLAQRFGVTYQAVQHWANTVDTHLHVETVARVAKVYGLLSATPGPSATTRIRAHAKGWVPPHGWDDDTIDDPGACPNLGADKDPLPDPVAVDRAVAGRGHWGQLNDAERVEAVRRLRHAGSSHNVICLQLGVSGSAYNRWRASHAGLPCAAARAA